MATITGFTKERMQAIEDQAIVDGDIVDTDLILTRNNGATINAGRVTGDPGPVGPEGPAGADADLSGYQEPLLNLGSVSGTVTLDFATYNVWRIVPSGNITIAFANPPTVVGEVAPGTIIFTNSSYAITWPAGTKFPKGEPPILVGETVISVLGRYATAGTIVGLAWDGVAV